MRSNPVSCLSSFFLNRVMDMGEIIGAFLLYPEYDYHRDRGGFCVG